MGLLISWKILLMLRNNYSLKFIVCNMFFTLEKITCCIYFFANNSCILWLTYLYNIHLKLIIHHSIIKAVSLENPFCIIYPERKIIRCFCSMLSDPWSAITNCHLSHANLSHRTCKKTGKDCSSKKKNSDHITHNPPSPGRSLRTWERLWVAAGLWEC